MDIRAHLGVVDVDEIALLIIKGYPLLTLGIGVCTITLPPSTICACAAFEA